MCTGNVEAAANDIAMRFSAENIRNMVSYETFVEAHRQVVMRVAGLRKLQVACDRHIFQHFCVNSAKPGGDRDRNNSSLYAEI